MVDQVLGGDITDDVIEKMSSSITDNFQGVSKPHHDFFKQEGGCCGYIILPGWSSLDPFGGVAVARMMYFFLRELTGLIGSTKSIPHFSNGEMGIMGVSGQ